MNSKRLKNAMVGDTIICQGASVVISEIYEQDNYEYYDIEFRDTDNRYRHWKQYFDGGRLISKDIEDDIKRAEVNIFSDEGRYINIPIYSESNNEDDCHYIIGYRKEYID